MVSFNLTTSLRAKVSVAKQSPRAKEGIASKSLAMTLLVVLFFLSSCNQQPAKPAPLKGELVFLLQYNNRLPTDVGFLTNHIMERRMANLMKENYEPFMNEPKIETPLVFDSVTKVITATYLNNSADKSIIEKVTVDVANDAIWIDYIKRDTVLNYADRTSLKHPQ